MNDMNRAMSGKRAFLFATMTLILAVLIGVEAGTAAMGVLDYALVRGKTHFADRLSGEVGNEHKDI